MRSNFGFQSVQCIGRILQAGVEVSVRLFYQVIKVLRDDAIGHFFDL